MSTHANICVEILPGDRGTAIRPNIALLGKPVGKLNTRTFARDGATISLDEISKIPATKLNGKFACIYHHWDGYPEALGKTLLNEYNTYAKALNLITLGDISTINEEKIYPYFLRTGSYDKNESMLARVVDDEAALDETGIVYLFRNGEWFYSDSKTLNFVPLTEKLNEKKETDERD